MLRGSASEAAGGLVSCGAQATGDGTKPFGFRCILLSPSFGGLCRFRRVPLALRLRRLSLLNLPKSTLRGVAPLIGLDQFPLW